MNLPACCTIAPTIFFGSRLVMKMRSCRLSLRICVVCWCWINFPPRVSDLLPEFASLAPAIGQNVVALVLVVVGDSTVRVQNSEAFIASPFLLQGCLVGVLGDLGTERNEAEQIGPFLRRQSDV